MHSTIPIFDSKSEKNGENDSDDDIIITHNYSNVYKNNQPYHELKEEAIRRRLENKITTPSKLLSKETLSCPIQASYKDRVYILTPIHHHISPVGFDIDMDLLNRFILNEKFQTILKTRLKWAIGLPGDDLRVYDRGDDGDDGDGDGGDDGDDGGEIGSVMGNTIDDRIIGSKGGGAGTKFNPNNKFAQMKRKYERNKNVETKQNLETNHCVQVHSKSSSTPHTTTPPIISPKATPIIKINKGLNNLSNLDWNKKICNFLSIFLRSHCHLFFLDLSNEKQCNEFFLLFEMVVIPMYEAVKQHNDDYYSNHGKNYKDDNYDNNNRQNNFKNQIHEEQKYPEDNSNILSSSIHPLTGNPPQKNNNTHSNHHNELMTRLVKEIIMKQDPILNQKSKKIEQSLQNDLKNSFFATVDSLDGLKMTANTYVPGSVISGAGGAGGAGNGIEGTKKLNFFQQPHPTHLFSLLFRENRLPLYIVTVNNDGNDICCDGTGGDCGCAGNYNYDGVKLPQSTTLQRMSNLMDTLLTKFPTLPIFHYHLDNHPVYQYLEFIELVSKIKIQIFLTLVDFQKFYKFDLFDLEIWKQYHLLSKKDTSSDWGDILTQNPLQCSIQ
jgi:hypothetical protein